MTKTPSETRLNLFKILFPYPSWDDVKSTNLEEMVVRERKAHTRTSTPRSRRNAELVTLERSKISMEQEPHQNFTRTIMVLARNGH